MEKRKKIVKMNLKTFIFILIIFAAAIAVITYGLTVYLNQKTEKNNEVANSNTSNTTNIEEKDDNIDNTMEDTIEDTKMQDNNYLNEKQNQNVEKINFDEGIYVCDNSKIVEIMKKNEKIPAINLKATIEFKDTEFKIYTGHFIVYGNYEKLTDNTIRCNVTERISDYVGEGPDVIDLRDKKIYIDLEIIANNKLKAKNCNYKEGTEFAISLNDLFNNENEYILFDTSIINGKWNGNYIYENLDGEFWKTEFKSIFGSIVQQTGSIITFNSDGTFEDYVQPINEGDVYRRGTYEFERNEVFLTYQDDNTSNNVKIYVLNENTILYDKEYYRVILTKQQ